MRKPKSVKSLEDLGRVRLSNSFYMRDFLYSEVANNYGMPNIPDNPDLAIETLTVLCETLLEPLNEIFGRVTIFSGYRSPSVNLFCNEKELNCASNESNFAGHICDYLDADGYKGAAVSVVVPWLAARYAKDGNWQSMAWWIHDNLPYHRMEFFPKLAAFNIGWREKPAREIYSFISENKGYLTRKGMDNYEGDHSDLYDSYPEI